MWFLSSSFFLSSFLSLPILIGRILDVYHTSTYDVVLVQIYIAGLKCAARDLLEIRNAKMTQKIAICVPSHNFVELYLRNCTY